MLNFRGTVPSINFPFLHIIKTQANQHSHEFSKSHESIQIYRAGPLNKTNHHGSTADQEAAAAFVCFAALKMRVSLVVEGEVLVYPL